MRLIRNPELKGILALLGIILVLAVVFLALTGTLTDWFGLRLTFKEPLTNAVVFISDRNGHPDVWLMKPDGSGQKALTNDKYDDAQPVISPDGYTIVFISKRDTLYSQIYAMDVDGTHLRRLTDITGSKSSPSFARDGKSIIFLCGGSVWRVGRRGDDPDRVLPTERQKAMATLGDEKAPYLWAQESLQGDLLAAVQSVGESQVALWMKPTDEAPQPIVQDTPQGAAPLAGELVHAAWCPDAERLALTLTNPDGSGILASFDFESESLSPVLVGGAMGEPDWSPDGSTLAVVALKRKSADDYRPMALLTVDTYGGDPRLLVKGEVSGPRWSPDGEKIAYVLGGDVYVVDVDSGKSVNLTKGKGVSSDPRWAPKTSASPK